MKKVMIIGCPGSGKSTFARKLREKTGLPLFYLDRMYWNADRTTVPKPLFRERLNAVIERDAWIIDGNYGSTIELRLKACDTVFFLDYPVEVCLRGIRERKGKERPDMPWIEDPDTEDAEFIAFIKNYNTNSRPSILSLFMQYPDKNIVIFQTREESDAYLDALKAE